MRIGFDANRAFFNYSGLGNYSRNIIGYLSTSFPEHDYYLYIPKRSGSIPNDEFDSLNLVYPESRAGRKIPSLWRSYWLGRKLECDDIELYHGLSNEIPFDMPRPGIRSVVTIHDLIFLRFPGWYKAIDRMIYTRKARHACEKADRIIAISRQTASDIQEFLGIPSERIDVVYQGCDPGFYSPVTGPERKKITEKYGLPGNFLLYVGTIEPRKNLLGILEAMLLKSIDIPLIVIGRATPYLEKVQKFIAGNSMQNIHFLKDVPNEDLPGIYQMADIFIYPSRFEGFGIPILEALSSGTPVITSRHGCFPEAGGSSSGYVDPEDTEELASTILKILDDSDLRERMQKEGQKHALGFRDNIIAENIMKVYRKVM
jgi:glycosyltransferase involved in cell wall biosynthesis